MSGTLADSEITVLFSELPQAHWFDMICRPIECDLFLIMQPQCRVQWSQVKSSRIELQARADLGGRRRKEEEETNLSIDATVAFGNSFRISSAASASSLSLCFFSSFYLRLLLLFLCSLAFFLVSVFLFFLTDLWSDVATVGGGRSSGKWMAPTTFNVFDGFISQMPTDTGRIDSYPNCIRTWSTSSNKLNSLFDSIRLNEYSHTYATVFLLHRLISHCCVDEVVFWPFSGQKTKNQLAISGPWLQIFAVRL